MRTQFFALLLAVASLFGTGQSAAQVSSGKPFADNTWSGAGAVVQPRVHQTGVATVPPPSNCLLVVVPTMQPPNGGSVTLQIVCTSGGTPTSYSWTGPGVAGQTGSIVSTTISSSATFTAQASNSGGSSQPVSARVTVQVQLSPPALPGGTVGTPYSQSFSAIGGTGSYTFSRTAGTLPPGLSLTGNVLSGTPTAAGDFTFTITASDGDGTSDARVYNVRIAGLATIELAPTTLPTGTANVPYNATVTATGGTGPYVFTLTGTLPPNVTFSSQGQFSGTPGAASSSQVTVTATDSAGNKGSRNYTLTINQATVSITLSPATLPNGTVGAVYPGGQITASGGTAPLYLQRAGQPAAGPDAVAGGHAGRYADDGESVRFVHDRGDGQHQRDRQSRVHHIDRPRATDRGVAGLAAAGDAGRALQPGIHRHGRIGDVHLLLRRTAAGGPCAVRQRPLRHTDRAGHELHDRRHRLRR